MNRTALVTGITGQDGAYLVKCLLDKEYTVYGTFRRSSTVNFWRLAFLGVQHHRNLKLIELDITDLSDCIRKVSELRPMEIYNLAAQSFVGGSFSQPGLTSQVTGFAVLNLLETIRIVDRNIRFYQASTSEMFGKAEAVPQDENTMFHPRSPYGVAKLYAHWMTVNYQESYGIFACSGILFNHESPLRGLEFVTRKITDAIARIKLGTLDCLLLGNLEAKRDWGFAQEYVEGMHRMMQHDHPDTFVLATGKTYSVRQFVQIAFDIAGIAIRWEGENENTKAIRDDTGEVVVAVDTAFYRPAEVDLLKGNSRKASSVLGWQAKTSVEQLCEMMLTADLERHSRQSR